MAKNAWMFLKEVHNCKVASPADRARLGGLFSDLFDALDDEIIKSSAALLVFSELWAWYSLSYEEGSWEYYASLTRERAAVTASYLRQHSGGKAAEMYMLGVHDYSRCEYGRYPEEWLKDAQRIDMFIGDNSVNLMLLIRRVLEDNQAEIITAMGQTSI